VISAKPGEYGPLIYQLNLYPKSKPLSCKRNSSAKGFHMICAIYSAGWVLLHADSGSGGFAALLEKALEHFLYTIGYGESFPSVIEQMV
jgi:hypothetical protein